jgi:phosphoserine phosphatase
MLVTVTGRDRPGVTSALFDALSPHDVTVLDVEQVVIRGRLILGVLVTAPTATDRAVDAALTAVLAPMGMDIEVALSSSDGEHDDPRRRGRSHVTVLGHPLRPEAMAGLAGCIAGCGANIDRIVRIAHYPVTAVEMEVSGAPAAELRSRLALAAAALGVDVAVERSGLHRRAKRLVVLDVDSTLVQGEVIEMLAEHAGCAAEVAAVTEAAMRGELDFADALRSRVALLEGLDASALDAVRRDVQLAPGARTFVRTLKRLDYKLAIVSGGFTQVTDMLVAELGIDYAAANTLEVVDGKLTGRVVAPVLDRAGKARALEQFAREAGVPVTQTVAIGDGANDLDMLALAGLGIAFNAKPLVREAADASLSVPYLDAILFLLGISREEIEAADAEEGLPVSAPPT